MHLKQRVPPPVAPVYDAGRKLLPTDTLLLDWKDGKRDRKVPAKIYFPTEGNGPFPVIIFSHGLGGSRNGYEYLGRQWAANGYVVVHLQHIGSDDSIWREGGPADAQRPQVQAVDSAWLKAFNANDIDAIIACYAPDAIGWFPNMPEAKGIKQIRAAYQKFLADNTVSNAMASHTHYQTRRSATDPWAGEDST